MGGHAKLVKKLRGYPEEDQHMSPAISSDCSVTSSYISPPSRSLPMMIKEPVHVARNILILGKREHGKSTLGNRLLNSDRYFEINDQPSQTRSGLTMLTSRSSNKTYKINVCDHNGLFEGFNSINALSSNLPRWLHLVITVLKYGRDLDENERKILKGVMRKWQISGISSLVLTHCESLSEKERGEMIEQFKKDHPSIAELMGKGILAVGFPDSSHIQPGSPLSQRVEEDKKKLRQLIYSSDEPVFLPQNENRRSLCCSIL
jgi:predicted GTPase